MPRGGRSVLLPQCEQQAHDTLNPGIPNGSIHHRSRAIAYARLKMAMIPIISDTVTTIVRDHENERSPGDGPSRLKVAR